MKNAESLWAVYIVGFNKKNYVNIEEKLCFLDESKRCSL